MIIILLGLLLVVNAQEWGSRPLGRNHEVFTEIYLDPAEREVTGSRFESSEDRGAEGAACDCQGICGYGRGSSGHLIFGNNKKSGAHGCHWCGHGQYDPSHGDHDKIVYCYNHVCNPGYVSICEQSKHFSIWAESYHPTHRACTCAKAAGQWTEVPGNYADEDVTTSTTQYEEYAHSVTNTDTVAIETSATYGVEIEGIGASSTLTMSEEFSEAVENSWTTGSSTTKTYTLHCGNDNKDTAWQYVIYMYDVLCASGDASKRFLAKANGGCAISAFLSGSGFTCTTSASEPPCCGPGANPIGTNDRKFCEDDYESWTGQCDGWSSRVRFTSIEDGRINCHIAECPDETDRSLQAHLSTCGQTCANNGYANTFVPSHVFDAPNMLRCKDLGWATEWFQKSYCKQISSTRHVVALMRRDCGYLVYSTSGAEFDDAYKSAEAYATSGGEDALDLVPIYYNNWQGVCDGHMNTGQEVENCKCDDECHKWGDCCNTCAEANSYAVESITETEWQYLGPLRSSLTEEEFKMKRDTYVDVPGGYAHYTESCVPGANIVLFKDRSVQECADLCNSISDCRGFEYGINYAPSALYDPRDCQLQSSGTHSHCDGTEFNLDFFLKTDYDYEWQKTTNLGCGYGGQCTSHESILSIGHNGHYSSRDGATVDECKATCEASPECAGFNYQKTGEGKCWFRRSVTCNIVSNNDRDCYSIQRSSEDSNVLDRYDYIYQGCVWGENIVKYTAKSVEECSILCDDMEECMAFEYGVNYGGSGDDKTGDCKLQSADTLSGCDGANNNLDLYIKLAHNICPSGFDAISNNLEGEGKKWASDKSSRTVQECANICKDRDGCTGFEYNEKDGRCGTYTGGSINVQQDEGRLYAASKWRSCLSANGRRRKL